MTGTITIKFERHVSCNDTQIAAEEAVKAMAIDLGYRHLVATDVNVEFIDYDYGEDDDPNPDYGKKKFVRLSSVTVTL